MIDRMTRFVMVMTLVLAASAIAVEARAQDDGADQCMDDCIVVEEACSSRCPEGPEGDACAEACEDRSDACMETCEAGE